MSEIEITSLSDFVQKIGDLNVNSELYFRGENRHFDSRIPSIYRVSPGTIAQRSKEYYDRLFSESEEIRFEGLAPFKRLSELQHFGGLTRFLDITKNSLVALYFAVEKMDEDGYVFVYRNSTLKTDDGDTAYLKAAAHFVDTNIVSSFINSDNDTEDQTSFFNEKLHGVDPQSGRIFTKFKEIRKDLSQAQIIIASKSNSRIAHQQGAFIAPTFESKSNYHEILEEIALSVNSLSLLDDFNTPVTFKIKQESKNDILKGLANLGINAGTVYPDIQHQSDNLVKVLTNYKLDVSQIDKMEPNIEDKINTAIKNDGQLFSGTAIFSITQGEPTLSKEHQKFIAGFHTQQVFMIEKQDDYFAGIRANHFVIEIGFSEYGLTESNDSNTNLLENKYALITANHKGERIISGINLNSRKSVSEIDELIASLSQSGNFATTHSIIGRLSKFNDFSDSQVELLAQIMIDNSQVNWLIDDDDVNFFYTRLFETYPIKNEYIDTAKKVIDEHKKE